MFSPVHVRLFGDGKKLFVGLCDVTGVPVCLCASRVRDGVPGVPGAPASSSHDCVCGTVDIGEAEDIGTLAWSAVAPFVDRLDGGFFSKHLTGDEIVQRKFVAAVDGADVRACASCARPTPRYRRLVWWGNKTRDTATCPACRSSKDPSALPSCFRVVHPAKLRALVRAFGARADPVSTKYYGGLVWRVPHADGKHGDVFRTGMYGTGARGGSPIEAFVHWVQAAMQNGSVDHLFRHPSVTRRIMCSHRGTIANDARRLLGHGAVHGRATGVTGIGYTLEILEMLGDDPDDPGDPGDPGEFGGGDAQNSVGASAPPGW